MMLFLLLFFVVLLIPGGYVNVFNNDVFETVITNLQPNTYYTISKDLPSLPTNKTFNLNGMWYIQ